MNVPLSNNYSNCRFSCYARWASTRAAACSRWEVAGTSQGRECLDPRCPQRRWIIGPPRLVFLSPAMVQIWMNNVTRGFFWSNFVLRKGGMTWEMTCLVGCSCICILNLSTTLQLANVRAVCRMTMSTQQRAFIVPSGSTTLYLFGAVHSTERNGND